MHTRRLMLCAWALALVATAACSNNDTSKPPNTTGADVGVDMGHNADMPPDAPDMQIIIDAPYQVPRRPALLWKRHQLIVRDLGRALGLPPDKLCAELGVAECGQVHHVSLGGNDPFGVGMYQPVGEPLSTTPAALDRLALSGCAAAVKRDAEGTPQVFTALDLSVEEGFDITDAAQRQAAEATIATLYKRLLAREVTGPEQERLLTLTVDDAGKPVRAAEFATLACFAIATTSEFVLY